MHGRHGGQWRGAAYEYNCDGKALKFDGEALNIDGQVLTLWIFPMHHFASLKNHFITYT